MKKKTIIAASAVILTAIAPLIVQQQTIHRLREQNLQARTIRPGPDPASNSGSAQDQHDIAELEGLRVEHSELLRLRAEVSRLRQQLKELAARTSESPRTAALKEPEQAPEAVQIFVANADAAVSAGETLVFGGWPTTAGKHTIVFLEPKVIDPSTPGHVG